MVKLKMVRKEKQKLDYKIELPKRFSGDDRLYIRIEFLDGEYQYRPRVHNFSCSPRLCIEELETITEELKRLNKDYTYT